MSDKLIGKTIAGRFVLEELLGTGATGSVYLAQQTSVDRVVAVKTLHPFLQERDDFKARFEIEAKAIARLNHPNLITLYDFGYDDDFDVFFMAVEYIRGEQLADLMVDTLPVEDVLSIAYQTAEALEHAHREGILHRDLKPENIMIRVLPDSGRLSVKVLDFGLARLYEAKSVDDDENEPPSGRYKQITEAGQVYGTPAYMSPEQCRGRGELSPATDIYALGTMMFELLEGHLPFFSKSTAELIMMQMTEDPPRMKRIDVPAEIRDLIHQMMLKDPEARPQSAKEVLITLLSYVRIDASQELRILPNASGELAKLTPDQIRALSAAADQSGERGVVKTLEMSNDELALVDPDMELSNDELRSTGNRTTGIAFGVVLVLFLAAAAGFATFSGEESALSSPATVDAAEATVADSPPPAAHEEEPVEVAETDAAKQRKKKSRRGHSKKATPKADTPTARAPDAGEARPPAAAPNTQDKRPKTLKLTY